MIIPGCRSRRNRAINGGDQPASIHGSARILTKDESDLLSTGETWPAEQ